MKILMRNKVFIFTVLLLLGMALRLVALTTNPPALYWDEASIAYNAYSIVTNGTDEYLNRFPITHFLAYGDAKPPIYIYATALFLWLSVPVEWAVRLPSALAGSLVVVLMYPLAMLVFSKKSHPQEMGLIAMAIAAVSPWLIVMSRAGFEANLALCFLVIGVVAFLKGTDKHPAGWWLLSSVSLIATLYTFNSYRIFLPFLLLLLLSIYWKHIFKHWKATLAAVILALVLVAPLIPFVTSFQARVRFDEVSVFKDQDPVLIANQRIEANHNALWARVVYNRRIQYVWHMLDHYLDHFDGYYLFLGGDVNPRLSTRESGIMYLSDLVALLLAVAIFKRHKRVALLLVGWVLLGLIPAGIARETPHALRSLQAAPGVLLILTLGYRQLLTKKRWLGLVAVLFLVQAVGVWHSYFRFYPETWADSWQYGYKQLSYELESRKAEYDTIYVTKSLGRPHTYLALYGLYHPSEYYHTADISGDPLGLIEVNGFGKYRFGDPQGEKPVGARWLIVSRPDGISSDTEVLFTITNPKNEKVFVGYER